MQIGSTNTSTINIGVSGDTVNIPSGVTIANAGTATGFGESNTPSFLAYKTANTSVANATHTAIINTSELYDTASAYDTSTGRFTPQTAGKYLFIASIRAQFGSARTILQLLKNGGSPTPQQYGENGNTDSGSHTRTYCIAIHEANGSSDYFSMTGYQNSGSTQNFWDTSFAAFRISS
jgi:hypothetical protein